MSPLKKIFFVAVLIVFSPSALLATEVNFELPVVTGGSGSAGGSGASGGTPGLPADLSNQTADHHFSGWTSPDAFIEIVTAGNVLATGSARADGSFNLVVPAATTGKINIRSTDVAGVLAVAPESFLLPKNETKNFSGIFLPPTLSLNATQIVTGEPLLGTGHTVPGALVSLTLTAGQTTKTLFPVVDTAGNFNLLFNTVGLAPGNFTIQISANYGGLSVVSTATGSLRAPTPAAPAGCGAGRADLNCDDVVDMRDISVLLFSFGKKNFPPGYDLNHDGKINLVDFSILLHYFGTRAPAKLKAALVAADGDQTPPRLALDVGQGDNGQWVAAFAVADQSDVASVQISLDGGKNWRTAESPYALGANPPRQVALRAADAAGNTSETIAKAPTSGRASAALALVGAALLALVAFIIYLRKNYV